MIPEKVIAMDATSAVFRVLAGMNAVGTCFWCYLVDKNKTNKV